MNWNGSRRAKAAIDGGWAGSRTESLSTDCTRLGESHIEPKAPGTSGTSTKLRLAIAAFYDVERFAGALRDIVLLGLLPDNLWLLTDSDHSEARAALRRALAACRSLIAELSENTITASLIPDALSVFCTDTPVFHLLRQARTSTGATCLEALLQGEAGEEIKTHVRKGAMLAVTKAETPTLQDHCVRALLRHSLHTVHSQEWDYKWG